MAAKSKLLPRDRACSSLSSKAISAERACQCCRKSGFKALLRLQVIDQFISELVDLLAEGSGKTDLVLASATGAVAAPVGRAVVPRVGTSAMPVVRRVPTGTPLRAVPGILPIALVVIAGNQIAKLAASITGLQVLAQVQTVVQLAVDKSTKVITQDCSGCIDENKWKQTSIRRKVTGTRWSRTQKRLPSNAR